MPSQLNLYDLTREELRQRFVRWGFSPFHTERLWNYLYLELADSFAAMPDLPAKVRARLVSETQIGVLPTALETDSRDGFTRKYLLTLTDQEKIETVLMRFTGRVTACVSSQVGCAMGCVFCATGQMGYTRHLTPGEIVAQAVHVARALRPKSPAGKCHRLGDTSARLRNVVLMGMGEPLHNYDAVMHAIDILRDPNGLALAGERITVSTVGVVPGILRLAQEKRPLSLAVSLHAATQAERVALVPVAKKWPLDELMAACRTYSTETGRRIFYEWTLIEGKNDSPGQAREVGRLLHGLPAQVNLIPLNPTAGYAGAPTRSEAARIFQRILADEFGLPSTVRQRRGIDIAAGCGQLAVG
ncbi:MAG: 23S rRNA (adenine(2503)-C(2))-methyltransferase RlmN [Opitutus sp.]|nr:23S rRNA (adenine(2503)-C(2))-methyltransferase RlmN [Opitutus sp.]